jgi:hypothetical protein
MWILLHSRSRYIRRLFLWCIDRPTNSNYSLALDFRVAATAVQKIVISAPTSVSVSSLSCARKQTRRGRHSRMMRPTTEPGSADLFRKRGESKRSRNIIVLFSKPMPFLVIISELDRTIDRHLFQTMTLDVLCSSLFFRRDEHFPRVPWIR